MDIRQLIEFHEDKLRRYRAEGFTTEFTDETLRVLKEKEACICRGNWRSIVKETEKYFGLWFKDEAGKPWRLSGILWADDDFYYAFIGPMREALYASCVGDLKTNGFTLANELNRGRKRG